MPRAAKPNTQAAAKELIQAWWAQTGELPNYKLADWDPDTAAMCQMVLEVLSSGGTVVFRPGSGGRAIGVAIWAGDNRPPAKWFSDHDELNEYTRAIVSAAPKEHGGEPPKRG